MAKLGQSLTGIWNGLYSYPKHLEPVFFVATLIAHGGRFSGTTHEAPIGRNGAPLTLFAIIDGELAGHQVNFKKTYDGSGGWSHSVMYSGDLSADRNEIEGEWTFPSQWSGRFLMIRGTGADESIIRTAYEKV